MEHAVHIFCFNGNFPGKYVSAGFLIDSQSPTIPNLKRMSDKTVSVNGFC